MMLRHGDLDMCLSFPNTMSEESKLQMGICHYIIVNPQQQFRRNSKGQLVVWGNMCLTATTVRLCGAVPVRLCACV